MTNSACFFHGHDLTNHGHIQVCKRCGLTGGYENPYFEGFFIGVIPYSRYIKNKVFKFISFPSQTFHQA